MSYDDGNSSPEKYWIELGANRRAGYSCLTSVDENTVDILYEGIQAQVTFQIIPLSNLLLRR
ncbi:sialidase family protein [Mariniflexile sp. AS56]|uniref:sialidase family protein n=1 Tax=Mariniflexile sp. AS56 TaxID=3063957 RepID=UPI0026EDBCA7|nr:sialidase family protein [Mariniflexile sp. AS56]MDO7172541.1 sialidase family protein [Mariniflexile sp. AS56]